MEEPGPAARFKEKGLKYGFPLLARKLEWKTSHWRAVILCRNTESSNRNAKSGHSELEQRSIQLSSLSLRDSKLT